MGTSVSVVEEVPKVLQEPQARNMDFALSALLSERGRRPLWNDTSAVDLPRSAASVRGTWHLAYIDSLLLVSSW